MGEIFTHRIEVFTADLAITGSYQLELYRRMSDALNGEQRRYIPLHQATIGPLGQSAQLQHIPTLLFDRSEANPTSTETVASVACLPRHEPRGRRRETLRSARRSPGPCSCADHPKS